MFLFWSGTGGAGGGGWGREARVSECITMHHNLKKFFLGWGTGTGGRGARVSEFLLQRIQI